jgi:hypothetical protein
MRFPLPLGVDKNPLHYTRLALLMGHYTMIRRREPIGG